MEQENTAEKIPRTQGPQEVMTGDKNGSHVLFNFSDNDLELRADFMPPLGKGPPLEAGQLNAAFERLNIVNGIRWDTIEEAIEDCNLNHRPVKGVLIARGEAPSAEVTEYFAINPLLKEKPRQNEENARIDYKAHSPFIIVKKDQALARMQPRKTGKEGKNVHGTVIPFAVLRPEGVSGGENTRTEGNLILSNVNGQLIRDKNTLNVKENLTIKGPVDYNTGHIIFPGDVMIEGPVMDGFKIYSGGSVLIKQTFDVTDAVTKGDLIVAGGIIGRGTALIKVGGELRTKFIENCRAAARKSITVDSEIINSMVYSLDRIELGEKGTILGGEVYAVHGIRAGGIGKKQGRATKIHCGIDFTADQEKEKNNNQMRIISAKLAKLREMMEAEQNEGRRAKMEELKKRLEDEQKKAAARVGELLDAIKADENAAVEVLGEIAPGTLIEICQVALFVTEPLKKVRIRFDKTNGKVISESL
ncbi:MAG: FapA family protein [Treponema sp.]|jgi:uncharacterized protein (DUF342 family)|nr:FapA family protein [Treponema sp.]